MTTAPYSPGLNGVISAETSVSYLDIEVEQILVRGYDLIDLAKNLTYTDVAYLTIYGELPTPEQAKAFCDTLSEQSQLPDELYKLFELMPKSTVAMDGMRTGLSFLAGYEDPGLLTDTSREANLKMGLNLMAKLPAITINSWRILNGMDPVKPNPDLGYIENFLYMLKGERPDEGALDAFDKIHMLYIEHEMPNSTFAARVVASTLSDIYGAFTTAVASLKGPLHGGANEAAINFLLDIQSQGGPDRAESYLKEKLDARARIMGFGHRVYMNTYDPRAWMLRDFIPQFADRIPVGPDLLKIYKTVEEGMFREKGLYPNTDYPIGLLYYLIDIPIPLYTPIFLASRGAGLVAHVVEQHENNSLFRPRVIYTGGRGKESPKAPISPR